MIINLNEKRMQVTPKSETRMHRGNRYILEYDPRAPLGRQWVWRAMVQMTYEYVGNGTTIETAARAARSRIDKAMRIGGAT
jgi:hypothetical protein